MPPAVLAARADDYTYIPLLWASLVALLLPGAQVIYWMVGVSLAALGLLGVASARQGGAPAGRAVVRVVVFGGLAMAVTALVGRLFEIAV